MYRKFYSENLREEETALYHNGRLKKQYKNLCH